MKVSTLVDQRLAWSGYYYTLLYAIHFVSALLILHLLLHKASRYCNVTRMEVYNKIFLTSSTFLYLCAWRG